MRPKQYQQSLSAGRCHSAVSNTQLPLLPILLGVSQTSLFSQLCSTLTIKAARMARYAVADRLIDLLERVKNSQSATPCCVMHGTISL